MQEDALNNYNGSSGSGSTGNSSGEGTKSTTATINYADLLGLLSTGADENAIFTLNSTIGTTTPVLTAGGTNVLSKGSLVSYSYNATSGQIEGISADGRVVFTLTQTAGNGTTDPTDDTFTYILTDQIDHPTAEGGSTGDAETLAVNLSPTITATDRDGDPVSLGTSLRVTVEDDVPVAESGPDVTVTEGDPIFSSSSHGAAYNLLNNDKAGADEAITISSFTYHYNLADPTLTASAAAGSTVNALYGELQVNADGSWSYTPNNSIYDRNSSDQNLSAVTESFNYTIRDFDGDTSSASQNIVINDTNPSFGTIVPKTLYEKNLLNGSYPAAPVFVTNSLKVTVNPDGIADTYFLPDTAPPVDGSNKMKSGGQEVSYYISADHHTLIGYTGTINGGAPPAGQQVFIIIITYPGSDITDQASYTFTLLKPLDQTTGLSFVMDNNGISEITLPFHVGTTDTDGDTANAYFNVTVVDDNAVPSSSFSLYEDTSKTITINADAADHTTITGIAAHGTTSVNADGTLTYTPNANYSGPDEFTYKLVNDNGPNTITTVAVTVNPVSDAPIVSGTSVTTSEDQPVALGLTAPAVRDSIDQNGATVGDDPERFGLITLGGIPDGAQLLKSDGTVLFTGTSIDHDVTIQLTDGSYINGLPVADLTTLSSADFNALKILPPPDSNTDFTVTMSVTEYEVDGSGNQQTVNAVLVPGVSATVNDVITVMAVTDHVDLKWQSTAPDSSHPDLFDSLPLPARTDIDTGYEYIYDSQEDGTLNKWIAEDSTFNLKSLLEYTAVDTADTTNSVFGNPPEIDGSEHRYIVLSNLPEGMVVNSTTINAGGTISIRLTGDRTLPDINITTPPDFSGNIQGIKVTLTTMDTDIAGETTLIEQKEDFVMLNLYVTPVANDIVAPDISTPEDTRVKFMENMAVSDALNGGLTSGGVELITAITILDLTSGWVIRNSSGIPVFTGDGTTPYTLPSGDAEDGTFKNYTVQPPAQSSLDTTVKVLVTTTDTATVNGVDVTDTKTVEHDIVVTVTPVAEVMGLDSDMNGEADNLDPVTHSTYGVIYPDSDGNSVADLKMNGSFKFSTAVNEDTPITFNGSSGLYVDQNGVPVAGSPLSFDFQTAWYNADGSSIAPEGSEKTWALLTPMTSANQTLPGSTFTYNDGSLKTILYQGTPIEIESKYLSTVTFQPPPYFAKPGIKVVVQAKTVDYDQDNPAITNTKITGEVVLTFDYNPVPNRPTLAVSSPVGITEDSVKQLFIRPTTPDTDGSESFTVVITGIPDGSEMKYNGSTIYAKTDDSGTVTIPLFDASKTLTIQPPLNSNVDFNLQVTAHTVEQLNEDTGPVSQTLDIALDIQGVADPVTLGTTTPGFAESRLDSNYDTIAMSSVITSTTLFDNDGSETLSVYFTGLADGFAIDGPHVAFLGGTGTARRWLLTPGDFANTTMSVPKNFSGTINFECVPVTTENDGNSLTGSTLPLSITVSPSPEATIVNSTTLNEDQLVRVNFDLQQQPGESNESLQSVWIKAADVDGKDFTLSYDSDGIGGSAPQTLAAAFIVDAGYYKLSATESQHIYVQNLHDKSGTYTFEVKYEITDPTSDGTTVPIIAPNGTPTGISANSATQQTTQTYTLQVNAVTDPISGLIEIVTAFDRAAPPDTDINGNEITIHGGTTLTIPVRVTQVDYSAENPGGKDLDGSELLKRFIIDGVPDGITVVGGTYIGDSITTPNTARWLFDIPDTAFTTDNEGSLTQDITLNIDGTAAELAALGTLPITITAESEDTGSTIVRSAAVSVILTFDPDFNGSGAELGTPALIDAWDINPSFTAEEDHASTLAELTTATISGSSAFSITLKNVPDGTIVAGMEYEILPDGETLYTASSTGDNAELQILLNTITLQPPANWNENNHNNLFAFDLTLTTYASGGQQEASSFVAQPEVLPVTDPTTITIIAPPVDEDHSETFTISFSNPADDIYANLVDGTLYLKVDESTMRPSSGGILSYNGSPITAETVSGVSGVPDGSYYLISGVDNSSTLTFLYTPQSNASGSIGVTAYIKNHESNANSADIVTSSKSATITINPVIDGYLITSITATGDEDTKIPLVLSGAGLVDSDGSESVKSVLLEDVHNDYLVYAGADAASAVLALNAGRNIATGHNSWALGSSVPAYIAILPPKNVSATINNIILTVFTAESGLATLRQDSFHFNFVVTPVADGITINPTYSFGTEGQKVTMNLNASMADFDGSETATLTLQGLGQYASFYDASGTLLTAANYEISSDTYTLSSLTVGDTNNLSVLQSARNLAGVTVTAYTLDNGSSVPSATVSGSFSLNMAALIPTTGNDTLLYDGVADLAGTRSYNALAGDDTLVLRLGESIDFATDRAISNIETIDLTISGNHTIKNLTYQDVVALTDFRQELYILGDSDDTLQLDASNGWSTPPVVSGSYNLYTNSNNLNVKLYVAPTITQS